MCDYSEQEFSLDVANIHADGPSLEDLAIKAWLVIRVTSQGLDNALGLNLLLVGSERWCPHPRFG